MTDLLYHGTTVDALVSMIADGRIECGHDGRDGHGVSFTIHDKIARQFATGNERAFDDTLVHHYGLDLEDSLTDRRGVVLVMRRDALEPLSKVDDLGEDHEGEWRTDGDVEGFPSCVERIEVTVEEMERYRDLIEHMEAIDGKPVSERRRQALDLVVAQVLDAGRRPGHPTP